jgi:hypothetical protein
MQLYYHLKKTGQSFFSEKSDCTVIALAVVAKMPYAKAHKTLAEHGRQPRQPTNVWMNAYAAVGLKLQYIDLDNRTVRSVEPELAQKYAGQKVLLQTHNHVLAWDGKTIQDWTKGSTRRIKGAFLVTSNHSQE